MALSSLSAPLCSFFVSSTGCFCSYAGSSSGRTAAAGCRAAVFFAVCEFATPPFIRLFYPDLAGVTAPYITIVNLTQILSVLSAYLFIIVLTFTEEKWQLILQCGHLALLTALVLPLTAACGLMGFSAAVLAANAVRVGAVLILGLLKAGKDKSYAVR